MNTDLLYVKQNCHYCGSAANLRPYGPNSSMVCFDCAMATPERVVETNLNLRKHFDACSGVVVLDGTSTGPYPIEHNPALAAQLAVAIACTDILAEAPMFAFDKKHTTQ